MWNSGTLSGYLLLEPMFNTGSCVVDFDFADPATGQTFLHALFTPATRAPTGQVEWTIPCIVTRLKMSKKPITVDLLATDREGISIIGFMRNFPGSWTSHTASEAEALFRAWQFQRGWKTR